jgi:hypothetical protein
MLKLSFIILWSLITCVNLHSQTSPHGDKLKTKCNVCHVSENWTSIKKDSFNHNNTGFKLVGQHQTISCKECHTDLIFDHANHDCNSCHNEIHQPGTGKDCERCHTPATWIVKNETHAGQFAQNGKTDCSKCHTVENWEKIIFNHNDSRFKLEGAHSHVQCRECHKEVIDEKGKYIRYKFKNIECSNCHS